MIRFLPFVDAGMVVPCRAGEKIRLVSVFTLLTGAAVFEEIALRIATDENLIAVLPVSKGPTAATSATWHENGRTQNTFVSGGVNTTNSRVEGSLVTAWFATDLQLSMEVSAAAAGAGGNICYEVMPEK